MLQVAILFAIVYFSYTNSRIARSKGRHPIYWILYTILGFFVAMFIGAIIVSTMLVMKYGILTKEQMVVLAQKGAMEWHFVFMLFISIGGCLFVRYLIERKPDIKS